LGGRRTGRWQVGDIAERIGLSLRTVRYYEEAGLVVPVARTEGGFRLYDDDAIDRFEMIKRMKPLGFTIDEMRTLLNIRQKLGDVTTPTVERAALRDQLAAWGTLADTKLRSLQAEVAVAESFVAALHADHERSEREGSPSAYRDH
jgi:DNA-binding transcriptional MerR regulator